MASPDGEFRDEVEAAGFRWHEIQMSRSGVNPLGEFATSRRLAEVIRAEKPDVLHTFTMKGNINGALAARLAGLRNVVSSIAGLGFVYSSESAKARILRPFGNVAYRWALARGETVFQNAGDREVFVRDGLVPADRAHLIRSSGVDVSEFRPVEPPAGRVRILYASRLLWTKGIGELVEAVRLLRKRGIDFELLVAGQPDPGNPATISAADIEGWVREGLITHLGFHRDMPGLMRPCHIACFPSKHKEGVPRFLVEAAAAGLPIVTTRNRGCIEIGREDVNALLVPIADAGALAVALERLIGDAALRKSLGAAGRTIAEEEFSVEQVAAQTEEVYRKMVGSQ